MQRKGVEMTEMIPGLVDCRFNLRVLLPDGSYRYDVLSVAGPRGNGCMRTVTPPLVGDVIFLVVQYENSESFRVMDRKWYSVPFGSDAWPCGQVLPSQPPLLELIVTKVDGGFLPRERTGA